jgi:hypothetical protein
MKTLFACSLALALWPALLPAQSFSIDWHKISGGGGTTTGGVYSLNATIGQHDAGGLLSGGNFSLSGGFWALSTVQSAGAPTLSLQITSTNTALIYWPSPSTGFNLTVNSDLSKTNWVGVSETVNDDGTIRFIIVNPPTGNRFYRLKNP